jgi:hypothetical protein
LRPFALNSAISLFFSEIAKPLVSGGRAAKDFVQGFLSVAAREHKSPGPKSSGLGCGGATEQKTGLSKFQATSSMASAGFLNGRNSLRE